MSEYILIAKLIKAFGLKGEMKAEPYTDFIKERFKSGSRVYLNHEGEHLPFIVKAYRMHKGFLLLTFKDYEDINLIEKYRGDEVYKAKEDIEALPEGEYYFNDLEGLDVYAQSLLIGKVKRVEAGPKYNYLRIEKKTGGTFLVPFIPFFILNVDLDKHFLEINAVEGLL